MLRKLMCDTKVKNARKFQPRENSTALFFPVSLCVELAFNQILILTFTTAQSCDGTKLSVGFSFCSHIWNSDKMAIWINDGGDITLCLCPLPHNHQPLCRLMVHSQGTESLQTLLRSEDRCCPAPGLCIRRS